MEVTFTPWPHDAVARGMALLDRKRPGWRKGTDLTELDMGDDWLCVLGQVFGDFIEGSSELGLHAEDGNEEAYYGFDVPPPATRTYDHSMYDRLTAAWREALAEPQP